MMVCQGRLFMHAIWQKWKLWNPDCTTEDSYWLYLLHGGHGAVNTMEFVNDCLLLFFNCNWFAIMQEISAEKNIVWWWHYHHSSTSNSILAATVLATAVTNLLQPLIIGWSEASIDCLLGPCRQLYFKICLFVYTSFVVHNNILI